MVKSLDTCERICSKRIFVGRSSFCCANCAIEVMASMKFALSQISIVGPWKRMSWLETPKLFGRGLFLLNLSSPTDCAKNLDFSMIYKRYQHTLPSEFAATHRVVTCFLTGRNLFRLRYSRFAWSFSLLCFWYGFLGWRGWEKNAFFFSQRVPHLAWHYTLDDSVGWQLSMSNWFVE